MRKIPLDGNQLWRLLANEDDKGNFSSPLKNVQNLHNTFQRTILVRIPAKNRKELPPYLQARFKELRNL